MAEIRVTSAQLTSKKEELDALNNNFKSLVGEMEGTVSRLKGSWEGETHDEFYNAFSKDKIQMDNFYNAVVAYIRALEMIIAKYEQAEQQAREVAATRSY